MQDDWDNLSESITPETSAACFAGETLAALATYEVWGGRLAHIGVVTHPVHRGRGHGRSAVAHLARMALAAGLIPQYRALESNIPSIRIAEALGFRCFATSVAVRLNRRAS